MKGGKGVYLKIPPAEDSSQEENLRAGPSHRRCGAQRSSRGSYTRL